MNVLAAEKLRDLIYHMEQAGWTAIKLGNLTDDAGEIAITISARLPTHEVK